MFRWFSRTFGPILLLYLEPFREKSIPVFRSKNHGRLKDRECVYRDEPYLGKCGRVTSAINQAHDNVVQQIPRKYLAQYHFLNYLFGSSLNAFIARRTSCAVAAKFFALLFLEIEKSSGKRLMEKIAVAPIS